MTSATLASNDFLAVMKEQRAQAYQSVANLKPSTKGRISLEEMQPLPASNSDALDDAIQQIKAVANTSATATADQAHNEITAATTTYKKSMGDSNAKSDFEQQMEKCKSNVINNARTGIDKAYDKAQELGANMSPSEQNSLVNFMKTVVEEGFGAVVNEITGFIVNAIRTLSSWIQGAFEAIKEVFAKIAAFIKSIF
ncbi:hypothetical protein [Pseudomonas mandelii]|uniref:hypothetical protein n=1 Tax=Pseudomonas mandelii TaxID=75612 RepID=UPI0020A16095|nr:hypothetical protein [Pseudomonas mandelii]MCO8310972.1 hypothetical protein [Pseudomonas mandelii]